MGAGLFEVVQVVVNPGGLVGDLGLGGQLAEGSANFGDEGGVNWGLLVLWLR